MHGNVLVINLIGRVFMPALDCPFRTADRLLQEVGTSDSAPVIIVDFHAEATSEKQALGWYLDGRVSAVFGTHTHVGTTDARVLPNGTAYISDVGMTGPVDSVIGSDISAVVDKFLTGLPQRLTVANGPVLMNSVIVDIDRESGKALTIERLDRMVN
jgi:metallophosphoesterase (TIGR00282 family)